MDIRYLITPKVHKEGIIEVEILSLFPNRKYARARSAKGFFVVKLDHKLHESREAAEAVAAVALTAEKARLQAVVDEMKVFVVPLAHIER